MQQLHQLREKLLAASPSLCRAVFEELAQEFIDPSKVRARSGAGAKEVNDPIWKFIELSELQVAIVDQPLMQRLRRTHQLGLASLLYPSAHHTRLEHSIGALKAATEMVHRLAESCRMTEQEQKKQLPRVQLAALVHDCGHPVFSHVGERVLNHLYGPQFAEVRDVLELCFPDDMAAGAYTATPTDRKKRRKPPPAAEILSALFVVSPAMEDLLKRFLAPNDAADTVVAVAGFILGKPVDLHSNHTYNDFLKNIISGDLDADKVDYVARDAYFAGLTVAADVSRLLSQLVCAPAGPQTTLDEKPLTLSSGAPVVNLLAVKPPGASALEMFVMTRAYLFERLYGHHKTRAAERLLERTLLYYMLANAANGDRDPAQDLRFLMQPGGDDAVIDRIAYRTESAHPEITELARRLVTRDLPKRSLALSRRYLAEYDRDSRKLTETALVAWNRLTDKLDQFPDEIEERIQEVTGLVVTRDFILDPAQNNPIKEDPSIWVIDPIDNQVLHRVNRHFDVEQLSNAYRDVKQTHWVFATPPHRSLVCAAALYILAKDFNLYFGQDAVRTAKLEVPDVLTKLAELGTRSGAAKIDLEVVERIRAHLMNKAPPAAWTTDDIMPYLDLLPEGSDIQGTSRRLAGQLTSLKISSAQRNYVEAALVVFRKLIQHAKATWAAAEFRDSTGNPEKRFQGSLKTFLSGFPPAELTFSEHAAAAGGFTDFIVRAKGADVIVELKSEPTSYEAQYQTHLNQPIRYSELNNPISLLYCQFKAGPGIAMQDTIQVKRALGLGSHMAVICLGTRAFEQAPSKAG